MNPNLGGGNHVANGRASGDRWCKQMVASEEASGLLVSGGSMASFVRMAVARRQSRVRRKG
jgi:hypothetical protein